MTIWLNSEELGDQLLLSADAEAWLAAVRAALPEHYRDTSTPRVTKAWLSSPWWIVIRKYTFGCFLTT
ncbi:MULTISPECIES: hypothetical protein [Thiorhodovibrio]|uniref:hypothetical protein n=1 Tax=Thiorhodovibrio TaxID=61593 RepID=UPI001911A229|nr:MULTISPECIES: hypothetical protein [Thiorhodovibrio]